MSTTEKNFENITIEDLKKSPIYAMSLASKELFHSNFWAWLIEHNSEYTSVFFEDSISELTVEREKDNMDIKITAGKDIYVIENKFKSFPDKEQLERYQAKATNFKKGCLAYVIEPDFELTGWKFLSYDDILNAILNKSEELEPDGYIKETIKKYCTEFLALINILTTKLNEDNSLALTPPKDLEEIRVHDIYSKLKAAKLEKNISEKFKEMSFTPKDECGFKYKTKKDYSSQSANFTMKYVKEISINNKNNDVLEIGIQIQADVIRHFVYIKKANSNVSSKQIRTQIFDLFFQQKWFDGSFKKGKQELSLLGNKYATNMKPKDDNGNFNTFKSSDAVFIYQHYLIDEKNHENYYSNLKSVLEKIKKSNLPQYLEEIYRNI